MFYECFSLLSVPTISKWNKNNNINKDNLFIIPKFKISKWKNEMVNAKGPLSIILIE